MDLCPLLLTAALTYTGPDMEARWARAWICTCGCSSRWMARRPGVDNLAGPPDIDRNTVVVFTSEHGEYAGSHGLRGKGAAAYEESSGFRCSFATRPAAHPEPGGARSSSPRASTWLRYC